MKKILSAFLLLTVITSLCSFPSMAVENETEKPLMIFSNKDFEQHPVGENPWGFGMSGDAGSYTQVVSSPADTNTENKAMVLKGGAETADNTYVLDSFYYAPVAHDFVVSLKFMVNDLSAEKQLTLVHDAPDAVEELTNSALTKGSVCRLIYISDSITVYDKNTVVSEDLKINQWYRLDLQFDMSSSKLSVFLDGREVVSNKFIREIDSLDAIRFCPAKADGSDIYIDDYKVYASDSVLTDDAFNTEWEKYKSSNLLPEEEFEAGILFIYDKLVVNAIYDEFLMAINGNRFYKDNRFYNLPCSLREQNGKVIVPVRAFCESFGAEVEWSNGKTTVSYNGKVMEFSDGSETYYVNGRPSKLYYPVTLDNGVSCMQLDTLTHFFGISYKRIGDLISFSGDIEFDYMKENFNMDNPVTKRVEEKVMQRIKWLMIYDRPEPEAVIDAYNTANPQNAHPRLLFKDFEAIKKGMESEEQYKTAVEAVIAEADELMKEDLVKYELPDGKRGDFPMQIYERGMNLSFAYKITNDSKYKDRLWEEIQIIKDFPDFNPRHFLDVGNSACGMAYIYDWLYDDWTEEERAVIEKIIVDKIFGIFTQTFSVPYFSTITSNTVNTGNISIIVSTGLASCALALFDKYPEEASVFISMVAENVERSLEEYYPDGAWDEGLSYWYYAIERLTNLINGFQTALGTDFNLKNAPGLLKSGYFPLGMSSGNTVFQVGDDSGVGVYYPYHMFQARQTNDMPLAKLYKSKLKGGSINVIANWVWDSEINAQSGNDLVLANDYYFRRFENVSMRNGLENGDTMVLFHCGPNSGGHNHLDTGSFQFNMLGERWAKDVTHENYNLMQYGSTTAKKVPGYDFDGRDYYRFKGEGHNTLIANYGSIRGDMVAEADVDIIKHAFSNGTSYAIGNMTSTNPIYDCAVRGVKLDKITGAITVQDSCTAKEETDFWWFMNTDADIELSSDGKSAVLTKNNKRIWAGIISDGEETFTVLEPKSLPRIEGLGYESIAVPEMETWFTDNTKRLTVHNPETDRLDLAIAFAPLVEGADEPVVKPQYIPMEQWTANSAERVQLLDLSLDGETIEGFQSSVYNYEVNLLTDKDEIPSLSAAAPAGYSIAVYEPEKAPGAGTVVITDDSEVVSVYNLVYNVLNNTELFLNDKQIPIAAYTVSSEPQEANPAKHLFDGNLETKFATDELGGNVVIDFGESKTVHDIKLAFQNGNKRTENFKIEYSVDGKNFTTAYEGENSGTTTAHETYELGNVTARYIRVSFYGNNNGSNWVSVTEMCAFTE